MYTAAPSQPEFNAAALAQLEAMGFPTIRCQKALLATGNVDADSAMEWLFGHMEDPGVYSVDAMGQSANKLRDIDDPISSGAPTTSGSQAEPDAGQISMLADMGFTTAQAKKALKETVSSIWKYIEQGVTSLVEWRCGSCRGLVVQSS